MKLDDYLLSNEISGPDFAAKIGVAPSTLWRLRKSRVRPDWKTMDAIASATDGAVTPNDFVSPEASQPELAT